MKWLPPIIILLLLLPSATASTVVLSSDQDEGIARYLANHLNATLVVIPWGSEDERYLEEIRVLNPDELIIVGGPYAVPPLFEVGNFKRYGGKDRVETAKIILRDFFNLDNPETIVLYPSREEVKEFTGKGGEWELVPANTSVALRWAPLIENELPAGEGERRVFIGNVENNPAMNAMWPGELPEVYSLYPSIIVANGTLFITGTDQNLPLIGRYFEGNTRFERTDLVVFLSLLAFLTLVSLPFVNDRRWLGASFLVVTLFVLYNIHAFRLAWDTLFVYMDGALSLLSSGTYETVVGSRGFPGLSYALLVAFKLFGVRIEAAVLYQILLLFITALALHLHFKRGPLSTMALLLFLALPLFREYVLTVSTELTFIALLLLSLALLRRLPLVASLPSALASIVRAQALLLPVVALMRRERKVLFYSALSLALYALLYSLAGNGFEGYVVEISAKGLTAQTVLSNLSFYLPSIVKYIPIPAVLLMYFSLRGELKPGETLVLGVVYLLLPLLWVAQDERYLLPGLLLLLLAALEPLDRTEKPVEG
ncbi:cell wall-binding repeat-containing protein [Palaeococcus ferrophilus]|uniref:cell wall-binding repeat-containing protein n=1 Tax=Palaeococcus ferrophilus TaxID=83868 RepID=UPI00069858A6|nr:hypothetical protein [Palaeococcus ferrophilus]